MNIDSTLDNLVDEYNFEPVYTKTDKVKILENENKLLKVEIDGLHEKIHDLRIEYNEKISNIKERYIIELEVMHDKLREYVKNKINEELTINEMLEDITDHVNEIIDDV